LNPKPRDFTQAQDLDEDAVFRTLRAGKGGTAMKSFSGILSEQEMRAVSAFVVDEFVRRRARNTAYHTPENGWPEHRAKYEAAYPFVLGERSPDDAEAVSGEAAAGRRLFLSTCITCHEPKPGPVRFEAFPLSHMGGVVRDPVDVISRASVYGVHDRPFEVAGLDDRTRRGKAIFDDNCAFCHARDGTGKNWIGAFLEPHPRDFTDRRQTAHLTPERLAGVIREGLPGTSMPAWGNVLSDDEVAATAAYIRKAFLERQP
jgi:cytochrome c oxidase cbb3-type subunit 3